MPISWSHSALKQKTVELIWKFVSFFVFFDIMMIKAYVKKEKKKICDLLWHLCDTHRAFKGKFEQMFTWLKLLKGSMEIFYSKNHTLELEGSKIWGSSIPTKGPESSRFFYCPDASEPQNGKLIPKSSHPNRLTHLVKFLLCRSEAKCLTSYLICR